jgi:hypothetical protein
VNGSGSWLSTGRVEHVRSINPVRSRQSVELAATKRRRPPRRDRLPRRSCIYRKGGKPNGRSCTRSREATTTTSACASNSPKPALVVGPLRRRRAGSDRAARRPGSRGRRVSIPARDEGRRSARPPRWVRHSSPRVPDSTGIGGHPPLSTRGRPNSPPREIPANRPLFALVIAAELVDRTQEVGGSRAWAGSRREKGGRAVEVKSLRLTRRDAAVRGKEEADVRRSTWATASRPRSGQARPPRSRPVAKPS